MRCLIHSWLSSVLVSWHKLPKTFEIFCLTFLEQDLYIAQADLNSCSSCLGLLVRRLETFKDRHKGVLPTDYQWLCAPNSLWVEDGLSVPLIDSSKENWQESGPAEHGRTGKRIDHHWHRFHWYCFHGEVSFKTPDGQGLSFSSWVNGGAHRVAQWVERAGRRHSLRPQLCSASLACCLHPSPWGLNRWQRGIAMGFRARRAFL